MRDEQPSVDLDDPDPPRLENGQVQRNYMLGIFSGAIGTLTFAFQHPEMIIGGMIFALAEGYTLRERYYLVAMVTVISKIGVLGPQLLAGGVEHQPRKRPYYLGLVIARMLAQVIMLLALWQFARERTLPSVVVFFGAYLVSCACMGASYAVFMDMAGRMIPDGRIGSYFGTRHSLGGLLALVCSIAVIHPVLNLEALALPARYLVLLIVGTALAAVGAALFLACREQPGPVARDRPTLAESLRRGWNWLCHDREYRNYFYQRLAFRVCYLGLTFFIPHGKETLAQATDAASVAVLGGILVATMTLSRSAASFLWGRQADRRGYRRCMIWGGTLFMVAPALALLAMVTPRTFAVGIPMTTLALDLPMLVYLVALGAMGTALQATVVGGHRFVIVTAPEHRRISYVGFLNTVTSPLTFLPFAAAWLANHCGTQSVFAVVIVGGALHLIAALRMSPVDAPRPSIDRAEA